MADLEELQLNLSNYKTQLQQVEATLLSDPDNEDLIKLKADLTEVLELTQDLVDQKLISESASTSNPEAVRDWLSWSVGDACMAPWHDKRYYDATIEEILEDDACIVTYSMDESTTVTKLSLLKARSEGERVNEASSSSAASKMTKKDLQVAQREYKKKKQQKKLQRWKEMEEQRESEKNKWLNFNTKMRKSNKIDKKKSIFATPDDARGKVGVGTCNVGGKPMTNYTHLAKWKK